MSYPKKRIRKQLLRNLRELITVLAPIGVGFGLLEAGQALQPGSGGIGWSLAIWIAIGWAYADLWRPWWRRRINRQRPGGQRKYFWRDVKFALGWPHFLARNLLGINRSPF